MTTEEKFGDLATTPFSEPAWYDSRNGSAYYTDDHRAFRNKMREFVDKEIMPIRDEFDADPKSVDLMALYRKAGEIGLLSAVIGWPEDVAPMPRPKGYDAFFSMIAMDELSRCGSGGIVWGLIGGLGIGLGPLHHGGSDEIKEKIVKKALRGEYRIALAVSEAQAGSDLAGLTTTAREEGDNLVISGNKKWITNGIGADFLTTAVKLEGAGKGFAAIRLVCVPAKTPGVSFREMSCMGAKGSGTAFIEYDEVVVPKANIVGGADLMLMNFSSERHTFFLLIAEMG